MDTLTSLGSTALFAGIMKGFSGLTHLVMKPRTPKFGEEVMENMHKMHDYNNQSDQRI